MNRRRLEAEAIRDSLLAVAGRLDAAIGRAGVRGPGRAAADAVPAVRAHRGQHVRLRPPVRSRRPRLDRRPARRVGRGPAGPLLPERPVRERAWPGPWPRGWRARSPGDDEARIRRLYALALGRPPSQAELDLGLQLLAPDGDVDPWERYCQLIVCQNEFIYVD